MSEKYEPSQEEIKKAEEMAVEGEMTPEQEKMSEVRADSLEEGEKRGIQNYKYELRTILKCGGFKPQEAEWDGDDIHILCKKNNLAATVVVKMKINKDEKTAWYEIYYPTGGFEVDVNTKPIDETIKKIEKVFGIKIPDKE